MEKIKVIIGVDCDPDRDTKKLSWKGVESLDKLFEIEEVKFTFNVRADKQIQMEEGSYGFCYERFFPFWEKARKLGHEIAWHLHHYQMTDQGWVQSFDPEIMEESVIQGSRALGFPKTVHMGWTWQSKENLSLLEKVGVKYDYSPVPGVRLSTKKLGGGTFDWTEAPCEPYYFNKILLMPTFTYEDPWLSFKSDTKRTTLHPTLHPGLYKRLLNAFKKSGGKMLITYFHADEIAGAIGGFRNFIYKFSYLRENIESIRNLNVDFLTAEELGKYYENSLSHQG